MNRGAAAAIGAAVLFGAGTPLAKLMLGPLGPWTMAGLLYLGSGLGLLIYRLAARMPSPALSAPELGWFAGAIASGGVAGPLLLMFGLGGMPASEASLLLNAEAVFTALLAWFAFRENFDARIALGMLAIVAGALVLAWRGGGSGGSALAVLGACLAWALDNNLTRKISVADASWIASVKGLASGAVNLAIAFALGAKTPEAGLAARAMTLGFFAYVLSLTLFVVGLRHLGTARTGAYFSIAPFFGALLAVAIGDKPTPGLAVAGALMAIGVWLHLTERHEHAHFHEEMWHDHEHVHDLHHQHQHDTPVEPGTRHRHAHRHSPMSHSHPHFPDIHHRHVH